MDLVSVIVGVRLELSVSDGVDWGDMVCDRLIVGLVDPVIEDVGDVEVDGELDCDGEDDGSVTKL